MIDVTLYDTTLRDGMQMEGMSLSVEDKLNIATKLDHLGVRFIEGGWPGSNPKDEEFFQRAKTLKLTNAKIVAFGSTRRAHTQPEDDANLQALLDSGAEVVTLVGKTDEVQVTQVLETTLDENLAMIGESIAYLRSKGVRVIFDAEHFFDGYAANAEYPLACVRAAADAGAETVVLCDTNGGTMPVDVFATVSAIKGAVDVGIGIHCHNDADVAVANSIAAVQAGATQVQGTINGYGERCGNANLLSVIGNLKLKLGVDCVSDDQLSHLTEVHRFVAELSNLPHNHYQPYVGDSAFTHKGGLHASATAKMDMAYQHVDPQLVGNAQRVVVSELAGRANIAIKLEEVGLTADVPKERLGDLLTLLKAQEAAGFQYEGAEASFQLLVRRTLPAYKAPFDLVDYMLVMEKHRRQSKAENDEETLCEAMVKVRVHGEVMHTVAEGNGPVNALDAALRKGLVQAYPAIADVELTDYKVRVVGQGHGGTGAVVRVLVESTSGGRYWNTVGASTNLVEASWQALADSLEYALLER